MQDVLQMLITGVHSLSWQQYLGNLISKVTYYYLEPESRRIFCVRKGIDHQEFLTLIEKTATYLEKLEGTPAYDMLQAFLERAREHHQSGKSEVSEVEICYNMIGMRNSIIESIHLIESDNEKRYEILARYFMRRIMLNKYSNDIQRGYSAAYLDSYMITRKYEPYVPPEGELPAHNDYADLKLDTGLEDAIRLILNRYQQTINTRGLAFEQECDLAEVALYRAGYLNSGRSVKSERKR